MTRAKGGCARAVATLILTIVVAAIAFVLFRPARYAVSVRQVLHALLGWGIAPLTPEQMAGLHAPPGFQVTRFAEGLKNPRLLRFTPGGDLLVSLPRAGSVILLERPRETGGPASGMRVLVSGLDRPHGLDLHAGYLYVAETGAVGRIAFDPATRAVRGSFERVVRSVPGGGNHWSRTVRFGPDGGMYVSVGSGCNACLDDDPRRAAILRFEPDGSGEALYASGLRNAVGFDWRPNADDLFATDNGRDYLGDGLPPCELNKVVRNGFYGWPFAYGSKVPDPDNGRGHEARVQESLPPVHEFPAHSAPLGITFLRGTRWPAEYADAALVALHGSWNRTRRDGYKVVSLHWEATGRVSERDFLWGFLADEWVIGRPVDVAEGPDGAVYVSDDYAGSIYRVAFGASAGAQAPLFPATPAPAATPVPASPEELAARGPRGKALYDTHGCARCHETGHTETGAPVKALQGLAGRYSLDDLAAFMAAPPAPMPPLELDPEARKDLAAFLLGAHP